MFEPTPEKLIPDLSPREELVMLARTLWREGYNDHLAGHITCNLGDGTLLCNPWLVLWAELRPHQVIRIVLGSTARAVHQRAVALEQRCQRAWHVLAAGRELVTPVAPWWIDRMRGSDGNGFRGFWEAMVRQEINADSTLLGGSPSTSVA